MILESPLDSKIKPVSPKGNQSGIFIGRTDAEAPILWSPDVKSRLIRKDPDAGKDWRQKEEGVAEDEMVGRHLNSMDMNLSKLQETVEDRGSLHVTVLWVKKSQTQFREWTTTRLCLRLSELRLCNGNFVPFDQHFLIFLSPSPWQPPFYSVTMNSAFLDSTGKTDYVVFVFLCLALKILILAWQELRLCWFCLLL